MSPTPRWVVSRRKSQALLEEHNGALGCFDHEEHVVRHVALDHLGPRKHWRIDVLQADVLHSEWKFLAGGGQKAVYRGLRDTVGGAHAHDEHAALRVCERRHDFRELRPNARVERGLVLDPQPLVEPGANIADVLARDWPFQKYHGRTCSP